VEKPAPIEKPAKIAKAEPPAKVEKVAKAQKKNEIHPLAPARELRAAYVVPSSSGAGLLSGAQPVVAAGAFASR
jgi:hypothetical protein